MVGHLFLNKGSGSRVNILKTVIFLSGLTCATTIFANTDDTQEELSSRREHFLHAADQTRQEVFEQDEALEKMFSVVGPWYVHPEFRDRPRVLGLWGPTGTGKTSTVGRLLRKLGIKNSVELDMQHFAENSGSSDPITSLFENSPKTIVDRILSKAIEYDQLEFDYEVEGVEINISTEDFGKLPRIAVPEDFVVILDEFQYANTLGDKGERINREKIQPIWEILGNGGIIKIPNPRIRHYQDILRYIDEEFYMYVTKDFTDELKEKHGIVKRPDTILSRAFGRITRKLTYDPEREKLLAEIEKENLKLKEKLEKEAKLGLKNWVRNKMKNEPAEIELNLSKALFVVLGNLDQLFRGASQISSDPHQADEFHNRSKEITPHQLRSALGKIFTPKDVARMGAHQIPYIPFSKSGFERMIRNEFQQVIDLGKKRGLEISIDQAVYDRFFYEYVIPSQGYRQIEDGRPVFMDDPLSQVIFSIADQQALAENRSDQLIPVKVSLSDSEEALKWEFLDQSLEFPIPLKYSNRKKPYSLDVARRVAFYVAAKTAVFMTERQELPSSIRAKSDIGVQGFIRTQRLSREQEGSIQLNELVSEMTWTLGGYAAEKLLYEGQEASVLSSLDVSEASDLANWATGNFSFHDFFAHSETINRALALPVDMLMRKALENAQTAVTQEQAFIRALALELVDKIELNADEIEKLARQHWTDKEVDFKSPKLSACDKSLQAFVAGKALAPSRKSIGFEQ